MATALQVIDTVYDSFKTGNIPAILSLVSDDATWYQTPSLPWGGNFRGPAGAGEFFTKMNSAVETVGFEIRESIERNDEVFSFGVYTAKGRGTGKVASGEFMFRWRVEDGKISSYYSYVDSGSLLTAL